MLHTSSAPNLNSQHYISQALLALKQSLVEKAELKFSALHHLFEVAYQADLINLAESKGEQQDATPSNPVHSLFLSTLKSCNEMLTDTGITIEASHHHFKLFSYMFTDHLVKFTPNTDKPNDTQCKDLESFREYTQTMVSTGAAFIQRVIECKSNKALSRHSFINVLPLIERFIIVNSFLTANDSTIKTVNFQVWNHTILKMIHFLLFLHRQNCLQDFEVIMMINFIENYRQNNKLLSAQLANEKELLAIEDQANLETQTLCKKYADLEPTNDIYQHLWYLVSNLDIFKQALLNKFKAKSHAECLKNAIISGNFEHVILITAYLELDLKNEIMPGKNSLELCIETILDLLKQPSTAVIKVKLINLQSIAKLLSNLNILNRNIHEYEKKLLLLKSTQENESFLLGFKEFIMAERLQFIRMNYRDESDLSIIPSLEACIARAAFSGHHNDVQVIFLICKSIRITLDSNKISQILCKMIKGVLISCNNYVKGSDAINSIHNHFKVIAVLSEQGITLSSSDARALLEEYMKLFQEKKLTDFKDSMIWIKALIQRNIQDESAHIQMTEEITQPSDTEEESTTIELHKIEQHTITEIMQQIEVNGAKSDARKLLEYLIEINKLCRQKKWVIIDTSQLISLVSLSEFMLDVLAKCIKNNLGMYVTLLSNEFHSLFLHLIDGHKQLNLPKPSPFINIESLIEVLNNKNFSKVNVESKSQANFDLPTVVSHLLRFFITLDQVNLLSYAAHIMLLRIIDEFRPSLINDGKLKDLLLSSNQAEPSSQQDFYVNLWHFVCNRNHYITKLQQKYHIPHHDKSLPEPDLCLRRAAQQGDAEGVIIICSLYKVNMHSTTNSKPKLNSLELAIDGWFATLQTPPTPDNIIKTASFAKLATFLSNLGIKNTKLSYYEELLPKLKCDIDEERYFSFSSYVKQHRLLLLQGYYRTDKDAQGTIGTSESLFRATMDGDYDNVRIIITYYQDLFKQAYPKDELTAIMKIIMQKSLVIASDMTKYLKNIKSTKTLLQNLKSHMDIMRFVHAQGGTLETSAKQQLVSLIKSLLKHLPIEAQHELSYTLTLLGANVDIPKTTSAVEADNNNAQESIIEEQTKATTIDTGTSLEVKETKPQEIESSLQPLKETDIEKEVISNLSNIPEENKEKVKPLEKMKKPLETKPKANTEKFAELTDVESSQLAVKKQEEAELKKQEALRRKQKEAEVKEKREAIERQLKIEAEAKKQAQLKKKQEEAEIRRKEAQIKDQKEKEAAAQRREAKAKKKKLKPVNADKLQLVSASTTTHQLFKRAAIAAHQAELIPEKYTQQTYSYTIDGVTVVTTCPYNSEGHAMDKTLCKLDADRAKSLKSGMNKLLHFNIHRVIRGLITANADTKVYYTGGSVTYFLSNKIIPYHDVDMCFAIPASSNTELAFIVQNFVNSLTKDFRNINCIEVQINSFTFYLLQFTYNGQEYDFNFILKENINTYFNSYVNIKSAYYTYDGNILHDMHHAIHGCVESTLIFNIQNELAAINIFITLMKLINTHTKWKIPEINYELFLKSLSGAPLETPDKSEISTEEADKSNVNFHYLRFKKLAKYIMLPTYKDIFIFLTVHFQDAFKKWLGFDNEDNEQFKKFIYLVKMIIVDPYLPEVAIARLLENIYLYITGQTNNKFVVMFMQDYDINEIMKNYSEDKIIIQQFELPYEVVRAPLTSNASVNNAMTLFATPLRTANTTTSMESTSNPAKNVNNNNV